MNITQKTFTLTDSAIEGYTASDNFILPARNHITIPGAEVIDGYVEYTENAWADVRKVGGASHPDIQKVMYTDKISVFLGPKCVLYTLGLLAAYTRDHRPATGVIVAFARTQGGCLIRADDLDLIEAINRTEGRYIFSDANYHTALEHIYGEVKLRIKL